MYQQMYLSVLRALPRTYLYSVNLNKFCTKATWWRALSSSVLLAAIKVCAFVRLFISDTTAPLPSLLTIALALSAPVLQTRTWNKPKEVWYCNTGADYARAVVNGDVSGVAIRGHFEHTVYSRYHIPVLSCESVYVIGRVHLILYIYIYSV